MPGVRGHAVSRERHDRFRRDRGPERGPDLVHLADVHVLGRGHLLHQHLVGRPGDEGHRVQDHAGLARGAGRRHGVPTVLRAVAEHDHAPHPLRRQHPDGQVDGAADVGGVRVDRGTGILHRGVRLHRTPQHRPARKRHDSRSVARPHPGEGLAHDGGLRALLIRGDAERAVDGEHDAGAGHRDPHGRTAERQRKERQGRGAQDRRHAPADA